MDPSSPIEKHFVFPPILYAGCQNIYILLSIASTRTGTASKGVARKVTCYEPIFSARCVSTYQYLSIHVLKSIHSSSNVASVTGYNAPLHTTAILNVESARKRLARLTKQKTSPGAWSSPKKPQRPVHTSSSAPSPTPTPGPHATSRARSCSPTSSLLH
jgi:hypothetical protein